MFKKLLTLLFLTGFALIVQAQPASSVEERLTRLEDINAVRTLLHSYGRYVDDRNWQAFSELFAEDDGTWDGGMGVAAGRDSIIEMMSATMPADNVGAGGQGRSNLHLLGNEFITVKGNTGSAVSKWVFVMTAETGGPEMVYVGTYTDELVKEGDDWKFQKRTVTGDIMQALQLD